MIGDFIQKKKIRGGFRHREPIGKKMAHDKRDIGTGVSRNLEMPRMLATTRSWKRQGRTL